jgi:hypothetical protein
VTVERWSFLKDDSWVVVAAEAPPKLLKAKITIN